MNSQKKALYEIIRQASYLPLHSADRQNIEQIASKRLRFLAAAEGGVTPSEDPTPPS